MSVYLFDIDGEPIAFRRSWADPHVFDLAGSWIGWSPDEDNDIVGPDGSYLGSVVDDRLVRRNDCEGRCAPASASITPPGHVQPTGRPGVPHHFPYPFAYDDVRISQHLAH